MKIHPKKSCIFLRTMLQKNYSCVPKLCKRTYVTKSWKQIQEDGDADTCIEKLDGGLSDNIPILSILSKTDLINCSVI